MIDKKFICSTFDYYKKLLQITSKLYPYSSENVNIDVDPNVVVSAVCSDAAVLLQQLNELSKEVGKDDRSAILGDLKLLDDVRIKVPLKDGESEKLYKCEQLKNCLAHSDYVFTNKNTKSNEILLKDIELHLDNGKVEADMSLASIYSIALMTEMVIRKTIELEEGFFIYLGGSEKRVEKREDFVECLQNSKWLQIKGSKNRGEGFDYPERILDKILQEWSSINSIVKRMVAFEGKNASKKKLLKADIKNMDFMSRYSRAKYFALETDPEAEDKTKFYLDYFEFCGPKAYNDFYNSFLKSPNTQDILWYLYHNRQIPEISTRLMMCSVNKEYDSREREYINFLRPVCDVSILYSMANYAFTFVRGLNKNEHANVNPDESFFDYKNINIPNGINYDNPDYENEAITVSNPQNSLQSTIQSLQGKIKSNLEVLENYTKKSANKRDLEQALESNPENLGKRKALGFVENKIFEISQNLETLRKDDEEDLTYDEIVSRRNAELNDEINNLSISSMEVATNSSNLFRHLRNSFSHGYTKLDYKTLFQRNSDGSVLYNFRNATVRVEDYEVDKETNIKRKVFGATMTVDTLIRLVEALKEKIIDFNNLEENLNKDENEGR